MQIYQLENYKLLNVIESQGLCTILLLRILWMEVYFLFLLLVLNLLFLIKKKHAISYESASKYFQVLNLNEKIHVCAYKIILEGLGKLLLGFNLPIDFGLYLWIKYRIETDSYHNIRKLDIAFLQLLLLLWVSLYFHVLFFSLLRFRVVASIVPMNRIFDSFFLWLLLR